MESSADRTPTPAQAAGSRAPGGTVEPAPRALRYELRDPFAEVTYRGTDFDAMAQRADALGSLRFAAVDEEGHRVTIVKAQGQWTRQPATPPQPTREPAPPAAQPQRDTAAPQPNPAGPADPTAQAEQAEQAALATRLEAALAERYVLRRTPATPADLALLRTEYRYRGDTTRVAFTESPFRLATHTNSPSVARSMVDVAQARQWRALRVSGSEEFRRLVWLEAEARGVRTQGYEPSPADQEQLRRERDARQANRIEPAAAAPSVQAATAPHTATPPADKAGARGGGGRKAVLAAIEAVLVARRVPLARREAILAAATEQLARRGPDAPTPKVRVYDAAAPAHRSTPMPNPERQPTRERSAPVR